MKKNKYVLWTLRIIPAIILLQTLYFKFTAHPESVALFIKLGIEPYGRLGIGSMELIAGVLLLIPNTSRFGAFLALGLMFGAIGSHLFVIGIESNGDRGFLFILAVIVALSSALILTFEKDQIINDLKKFKIIK